MRRHAFILGAFILAVAIAFVLSGLVSARSRRSPIQWQEPSLVVTMAPGESKTIQTSFSVSRRLRRTSISVSENLQHVVSVSPSEIRRAKKGESVPITVVVGGGAATGKVQGQLEVRRLKRRGRYKVLADALPITIEVVSSLPTTLPSTTTAPSTVTSTTTTARPPTSQSTTTSTTTSTTLPVEINLPSELLANVDTTEFSVVSSGGGKISVDIRTSAEGGPLQSSFGMLLLPVVEVASVEQWFRDAFDPEGTLKEGETFIVTNGEDGRQVIKITGPIATEYAGPPLAHVYILSPQRSLVVAITLSQDRDLGYAFSEAEQAAIVERIADLLRFKEGL